jgi:hypothetical protein
LTPLRCGLYRALARFTGNLSGFSLFAADSEHLPATPNGKYIFAYRIDFKAILPHSNPLPSGTLNRLGMKQKHLSIQLNNIDN